MNHPKTDKGKIKKVTQSNKKIYLKDSQGTVKLYK